MTSAIILAAAWITLAPVLTPRQEVAVAAVNGKVYLIGGFGPGGSILSSVEEYDPATNTWRFIAPLPAGRHHTAAAVIGSSIYVVGGFSALAFDPQPTVYRYDTLTDQWTRLADLPKARGALGAVAIDGKIYAVGGLPDGTDLTVYDPATNMWTVLPPMPTPRDHLAAVAAGGILFVAGGRFPGNTNAFECYEPGPRRWTSLPPMPSARAGIAGAVLNDRIYIFGGEGNPASFLGTFPNVESFDLDTFAWRAELSMPNPRHGIGAAAIDPFIYIPAGGPIQGFGVTDHHDAFVPETPRRRSVRH